MELATQNLVAEIENDPQSYIGKVFNAECKFRIENCHHICRMQMKILDIKRSIMHIEPVDKSSPDAQIMKAYWFGSNVEGDFSKTFILDLIFETPDNFSTYCKFLDWA